MKKLFLLVLFSMFLVISCSDANSNESVVAPTDNLVIEKQVSETSSDVPVGNYPFMQEFINVNIIWQLKPNDNLYVKIPNYITYTITSEYFLLLTYQTHTMMVYINKPNKSYFTIPYCGTADLIDVKLMAIFTY